MEGYDSADSLVLSADITDGQVYDLTTFGFGLVY
jgi:hypothetical protein